ncbi:hypothetical protein AS026_37970 [Rhizobium altiplani]|uniref:Uncharacterized protein n=1 Tax=Rhizobium altiplani TaxID=1864509 RepID=A0A120FNB2_9HYPH|nr:MULTISPECIES: DUF5677 domain-containing protein [Rhizobium]KWV55162.1 hypothetical protein AS026_37970 [Rhizobium altiplani]
MPIRPAWRKWFADFAEATDYLQITKVSLEFSDNADVKSVVLALYARLLSELITGLLLADAKRDIAFRSTCRSVIECSLHLEMAESDPTYLKRLKEDDDTSRRSRAIRFRTKNPNLAKESDKTLSDFIKKVPAKSKKLQLSEHASVLPRLTHVYRELSADTLHVSLTSIDRHLMLGRNNVNRLRIEPKVDTEDMEDAASVMALALLNATRVLLSVVPEIKSAKGFHILQRRYVSLFRQGLPKLKKAATSSDEQAKDK